MVTISVGLELDKKQLHHVLLVDAGFKLFTGHEDSLKNFPGGTDVLRLIGDFFRFGFELFIQGEKQGRGDFVAHRECF